ncbi:Signal recognition particle receptor FtsY [Planctomycetes bacterium Pan216]|uniref:Signal recognition particle receptor FtsY n=1 Tax=Kolteria novifilia TaxID=2527975 RepID=A0A518B0X0_9BACT|nr:Signal recognition particle receptor FtsY [Planctomycetes bacterium Pan216]
MPIGNFFQRIKAGLRRTAQSLGGGFRALLGQKVDADFLDQLEAILLKADVGVAATERIIDRVKESYGNREATGDLLDFVKSEVRGLLQEDDTQLHFQEEGPTVIMVAGVNGSGKTTSIAKLTKRLSDEGRKVLLGAGDTFRAAAIEQLSTWAERTGADIVKGSQGSDPSSVAHDACTAAMARKVDVAIIDTAGRLHTQANLMRELEKIHRVIGKVIPGAPHEVLMVIDSTNGQNAIAQAENFTKAIECTGLILAKLDGTAKGGAALAIRDRLGLPVKFVGVGEKAEDLEAFNAEAFVDALFATE